MEDNDINEQPAARSPDEYRLLRYERALRDICVRISPKVDNSDYDPADLARQLVTKLLAQPEDPKPLRLHCPAFVDGRMCGTLHVDVGEWETKPHKTHTCQACGHTWKPALFPTVGVQFLPGTRSMLDPDDDLSDLADELGLVESFELPSVDSIYMRVTGQLKGTFVKVTQRSPLMTLSCERDGHVHDLPAQTWRSLEQFHMATELYRGAP